MTSKENSTGVTHRAARPQPTRISQPKESQPRSLQKDIPGPRSGLKTKKRLTDYSEIFLANLVEVKFNA